MDNPQTENIGNIGSAQNTHNQNEDKSGTNLKNGKDMEQNFDSLNEIILNEDDDFDDEDYIEDEDEDYSEIVDNSKSQFSLKTSKQNLNNHNK